MGNETTEAIIDRARKTLPEHRTDADRAIVRLAAERDAMCAWTARQAEDVRRLSEDLELLSAEHIGQGTHIANLTADRDALRSRLAEAVDALRHVVTLGQCTVVGAGVRLSECQTVATRVLAREGGAE
jgi:hypothetical protein